MWQCQYQLIKGQHLKKKQMNLQEIKKWMFVRSRMTDPDTVKGF